MFFRFINPSSQLVPYINEYVLLHNLESGIQLAIDKYIPGLGGGMVFHFRDSTQMITSTDQIDLPNYFLYAPQQKFIWMKPGRQFDLLIVKFKPSGLSGCLGIPPLSVANEPYVDLQLIYRNALDELYDRMVAESIPENRIKHIEAFLCNQISKRNNDILTHVDLAANLIIQNKGCEKLSTLCKILQSDQRTFRRNFTAQIGISPKSFSRLVRINHIINDINLQPDININDIVFKYNYFDQSHLINDFKTILGETPHSFQKKDKHYQRIISAHH